MLLTLIVYQWDNPKELFRILTSHAALIPSLIELRNEHSIVESVTCRGCLFEDDWAKDNKFAPFLRLGVISNPYIIIPQFQS